MKTKKIAVLGAGHGGYGMAADLTLAGYEVHFYGSRERGNLEPVIKQGGVELTGIARQGFAAIHRITNDIAEALEEKIDQEVDRRKIDLEEPLKELGTHAVTIRLAPEAEAKVTVIIEREE